MPDVAGDSYRVVVDETSFDFRGLRSDELTDSLDDFSDALEEIQCKHEVARAEIWDAHECLDGCELLDFLYTRDGPGEGVSPDARRRLAVQMDRCRTWEAASGINTPDTVQVGDETRQLAWTLGHALLRSADGHTIACLSFPTARTPHGWLPVTDGTAAHELYFFTRASQLPPFWRVLYLREGMAEHAFLSLAPDAFPRLVLADSLTFGRFSGTYREVAPWVVHTLGALNDHFAEAMHRHSGIPHQVRSEFGRFDVDLSPESPNTHRKPKIMRQRQVEHEGETYVCEWHAKQHPDRNRIHFSCPDERLDGRILVGIFVDHLDT